VLRTTVQTLRQPRYAALSALMIVVALACIGAGSWQIARFDEKVHANDALTANAHAAPVPVARVLPLVGRAGPSADAVRFRTVTVTGRYDGSGQGLVRLRTVDSHQGYYVLTPLRTADATLLVVRGFVPERADGSPPNTIAAPPSGPVTVRGRVQVADQRHDRTAGLPPGQLLSINPGDQAARLGGRFYAGYIELLAGQPGAAGLTPIPPPDLSNPAGGAVEPQHFAYVIQWYLFAALALAAPIVMARAERREQEETEPDRTHQPAAEPSEDERRAAKLADRYGRPVH
jgi:cytochrome oxidase assembly protein ShyY1